MTRSIGWALAAYCVAAPTAAGAKPMSEVHERHPGRHHAEHPNLIGVRVGFLSVFVDKEKGTYLPGVLGGLSYERTVIHEWLEVELSVPIAVLVGPDGRLVAVPVDVHFKKPFHPGPRVSPYVAVGPAFDLLVVPETRLFFGGSFAVGTYLWPAPRLGIDMEVDYNLIAEGGRPVHELLLAVAPVFRF